MRADLQSILNNPAQAISVGQLRDQRLMVMNWLALQVSAPLVTLTPANMVNKVIGLQGVTDANMIDLQIYGLANKLGLLSRGFASLAASAVAAIDGPNTGAGFISPTSGLQANISADDYDRSLWRYAALTGAGAIADPS